MLRAFHEESLSRAAFAISYQQNVADARAQIRRSAKKLAAARLDNFLMRVAHESNRHYLHGLCTVRLGKRRGVQQENQCRRSRTDLERLAGNRRENAFA